MKKIAVIAAHPDDEALGCGGTLLKCREQQDEIHLLFMTDGISARPTQSQKSSEQRNQEALNAISFLDPASFKFLNYPDNRMDAVPLLDLVYDIEKFLFLTKPDIILTHFPNDLNVDHRLTCKAAVTATRAGSKTFVKKILCFEVLSSTEWAIGTEQFHPNYYVDISAHIDKKIEYLKYYDKEMRAFPHPRSYENVRALSQFRGSSMACSYAEAFQLLRRFGDAF